jgi:hypothetical protein
VEGLTPPKDVLSKFHDHELGKPVEPSENVTEAPAVTVFVLVFIAQVGGDA